jgi:hypothetical protein
MNDLDSQLIFEAYSEEVIDEGLKDVANGASTGLDVMKKL